MSDINKVILVGHLGKDPELRYIQNNVAVVSFPLVTSECVTKDGKRKELTEWHNIVMWRGIAESAARLMRKGQLIYLEGKLRTRAFKDKEGVSRYCTEIVAENFQVLSQAGEDQSDAQYLNRLASPSLELYTALAKGDD